MNLDCTETFEKTWIAYHDKLTPEEWEKRKIEYIREGIKGLPSWFRYNQVVSMGGSRSSKTWSILQILLTEMVTRKNIKITVWRSTKTECRANVMDDFIKILHSNPEIHAQMEENKQKARFIYLQTGSTIYFEGADDVGKVLGSSQDISFFNEINKFNLEVYRQISQRTAERVICDYNPSEDFWLEKMRKDEETIFIHSDFRNNIFCPVNIQKRLLSYEPWETGSYEVRDGWVYYKDKRIDKKNQPPPHIKNIEKGTANEYMWLVYGLGIGAEKPNKIYFGWKDISLEDFLELPYTSYFGLDFGTSVPTALVEVKYNDGAFYVRPRFYKPIQDVEDSLGGILRLEIPDLIKKKSLLICDSAKLAYIDALIDEGYDADGAIKGGGSIDLGITTLQKAQIFVVWDEDFKSEYDDYSWETDKNGKSKDVPLKIKDHYMDATRYIITYLISYLRIPL